MDTLKRLQHFMGNMRILLPISLFLSGLSAVAGLLPYLLIWLIVKELLETGSPSEQTAQYSLWAAGLAVIGIILYFGALMSSHLAAFRVESNIRREAMHQMVRMPLGFFENTTSGRIRKIIDDNAGITHSFIAHQMPDLVAALLMPIVALGLIIWFNWQLGLACITPIILAMLLMAYMMGTKGREFMQLYMNALEEMNTEAVEYVRGIPVVKVFQQTIYSFKHFHQSIMDYNKMVKTYTQMWQHPMSLYTILINGFVYFLTPLTILMIGRTNEPLSVLPDFFLFVLITPLFSECIMKCMYLSQAIGQTSEAINRLDNLLSCPQTFVPVSPKCPVHFDISFEHVSFKYPDANGKAVDDVTFSIPEGKKVALVGTSGSGKTTIARLVPRFWDVQEGCVKIGGIDVRDIAQTQLMQNISFVFQNTKLFKRSLRENIRYGKPNATDAEILKAVEMAQCDEIISKQLNGLDTCIGSKGTYLSGGEQQRIALARALLKDSPIVILDEATAFADPENEYRIQQAFARLAKGKTVLMIAHRLSSVIDADEILVIDHGKIAERGTHIELIARKGIYSKMWNEYQQSVSWTIGKEVSHE